MVGCKPFGVRSPFFHVSLIDTSEKMSIIDITNKGV